MQEVKQDILKFWEEKQLRITDDIQTASEVLSANGSVIGTLGNFSASTVKPKTLIHPYKELTEDQHCERLMFHGKPHEVDSMKS